MQAFAAKIGKSVQWARKLARENAPEWQQFIEGSLPDRPVPRVEPVDGELERAKRAREIAWDMLQRAAAAAKRGGDDAIAQAALNRAVKEARDVYEKACKHATQQQVLARELIPVEKVLAIRGSLRPLEDVVQNWETTLSGALPDEMRPAFHQAFKRSRAVWNQGIQAAEDYINSLLPLSC